MEAVLGMGYPSLSHKNALSFVDTMMKQPNMPSAIFAFYYTYKRNGVKPEMTMGYYDKTKFKGQMNWYPTVEHRYYSIKLDDVKIKGQALNLCKHLPDKETKCLITIDTGAVEELFPGWIEKPFEELGYPTMSKAKECNSINDIGDITFVIGGKDYVYPAENWLTTQQ